MIVEIKVPSPGESINEVEIGRWLVENGSLVIKGQEIAEVESDKATLTIVADVSGRVNLIAGEGMTVAVGFVVCTIDTSADVPVVDENAGQTDVKRSEPVKVAATVTPVISQPIKSDAVAAVKLTAVAREMMKENQVTVYEILSGLKRIGKNEVGIALQRRTEKVVFAAAGKESSREQNRERLTPLRRKLAERLVAVKNETAMLTTFNEVDMSAVMEVRKQFQQKFTETHGLKLGFMAFFTKAAALAMKAHPSVNSQLDGDEIMNPDYVDIGIAVQTPKGLMVPVVRNTESKSIAQIELEIKELAEKARTKKITIEELAGGTFTITNGGVFGSLLSTPILNPPQSAILGMHNIVERPVAVSGKVEIRPMMYIALSYDHRLIDGKDSVGFLVKVKEMIENPQKMQTNGKDPLELLLEI